MSKLTVSEADGRIYIEKDFEDGSPSDFICVELHRIPKLVGLLLRWGARPLRSIGITDDEIPLVLGLIDEAMPVEPLFVPSPPYNVANVPDLSTVERNGLKRELDQSEARWQEYVKSHS